MSPREIQNLRIKFIRIAMLSIFLAMLFIGLLVNIGTLLISRISINRTLDAMILDLEGSSEGPEEYQLSLSDVFSPVYNRNDYYVLGYDENGELYWFQSNIYNEYESGQIKFFAESLIGENRRGEHLGFYYKSIVSEEQVTYIAFLEGSVMMSQQFRTLILTLAIGFFGLVITFFLVLHLSEKVIQPEVENSIRQKLFITNASHELKTPLAVIRANTEMVEMTQGESEWTTSTIRQVDHLNGLIQNLVMITRSEEREGRSEMSEIDVSKAVNESIDPYESLAMQTQKSIKREIETGVRFTADESEIRQLTTLLIDNALKYCDEKGTVQASLHRLKNGKEIMLSVSNDYAEGASIDYSRFFERFYREDASHNIDKGGYGIGLSIAKSICHQYKGDISADWKNGVISFVCLLRR